MKTACRKTRGYKEIYYVLVNKDGVDWRGNKFEVEKIHLCKGPITFDNSLYIYKNANHAIPVTMPNAREYNLLEVNVFGSSIRTDHDYTLANGIKVLREVPKSDWNNVFTMYKFDDRGNCIYEVVDDGIDACTRQTMYLTKRYEYDLNNNCIHSIHSNGFERWYKFDENNNNIYVKCKNDYGAIVEYWHEYDNRGNCIHSKDSYANEHWYEYDNRNNITHEKNTYGSEFWYKYDKNNNRIYRKDHGGQENFSDYNKDNELIHYRVETGSTLTRVEAWLVPDKGWVQSTI